jgi:hypothetical protein
MWEWVLSALKAIGGAASEFGGGVAAGAKAGLTGGQAAKMGTFGTIGEIAGMKATQQVAPKYQTFTKLGNLAGLGGDVKTKNPVTGKIEQKRGLFNPLF